MSSISQSYSKKFEGIELISFDVWNTLLKGDPRFKPVRVSIIADMLGSLDPKVVNEAAVQADAELDALTESNGEDYGFVSRVKTIAKKLGIDPEGFNAEHYAAMQDRVNEAYAKMPPHYGEDLIPAVLRNLKARGFKLALLSNTGFINGTAMKRAFDESLESSDCFTVRIFSNEVGIAKPHRQIFNILAQQAGVSPSAVLHIGDSIKADYQGALKSGMRALLYDPAGKTDPSTPSIKSFSELESLL